MRDSQVVPVLLTVVWLIVSHLDITCCSNGFNLYIQKRQALSVPPTGPPPTGSDRPTISTTASASPSSATTPTPSTPANPTTISSSPTIKGSTASPSLSANSTISMSVSPSPSTKPGSCPTISFCFGFVSGCTSDVQCPGTEKCCGINFLLSRKCCFAISG